VPIASTPPARGPRRPRRRRRRRWTGLVLLLIAVVFAGAGLARLAEDGGGHADGGAPPSRLVVEVTAGDRTLQRLDVSAAVRDGRVDVALLRGLLEGRLHPERTVAVGRASVVYGVDVGRVVRRVMAAGDPLVRVAASPRSSAIRAPAVAQALRNNCESAALEVLLATVGKRRAQLALQDMLPTSGLADPVDGPEGRVWGDPELGFVGRPDGGGAAGGFGVYQRPVRGVAAELGVDLVDMTGSSLADVLAAVRSGRAVMVWIGLSAGPFGSWRSPDGRPVRVNFGEHTVVLTGVDGAGGVSVVNVLQGTRERWTQSQLLEKWERLGRRALAAPPPS
jgi:uncharacterized protein YvpB